jgi:rfaE bifunctional protein nucleotidyltransferase chain/domain
MSKILTTTDLSLAARDWRKEGAVIVLAAGCFDPIHVGHVQHLRAARALGNVLVVSVAGDDLVRATKQLPGGPRRPFMPAAERAEIVAALACVDAAVICDRKDARHIIKALRPAVYAKGEEYRDRVTRELAAEGVLLDRLGGRMEYVSGPLVRSSSAILAGV